MWCDDACDAPTIERLSPLVGRNQKNLRAGGFMVRSSVAGLMSKGRALRCSGGRPIRRTSVRGDLTGLGEQVGELLLGGDDLVVEFGGQP